VRNQTVSHLPQAKRVTAAKAMATPEAMVRTAALTGGACILSKDNRTEKRNDISFLIEERSEHHVSQHSS